MSSCFDISSRLHLIAVYHLPTPIYPFLFSFLSLQHNPNLTLHQHNYNTLWHDRHSANDPRRTENASVGAPLKRDQKIAETFIPSFSFPSSFYFLVPTRRDTIKKLFSKFSRFPVLWFATKLYLWLWNLRATRICQSGVAREKGTTRARCGFLLSFPLFLLHCTLPFRFLPPVLVSRILPVTDDSVVVTSPALPSQDGSPMCLNFPLIRRTCHRE